MTARCCLCHKEYRCDVDSDERGTSPVGVITRNGTLLGICKACESEAKALNTPRESF